MNKNLCAAILLIGTTLAVPCAAQETTTPMRTLRYTPGTADQARAWQEEVRGKLFGLLKLDDLVRRAEAIPLDPEVLSTSSDDAMLLEHVSIRSTESRRITVAVARPLEYKGKRPGVVAIHGHGGDRMSVFDAKAQENAGIYKELGKALVRRGYFVVAPEVGQHKVYEDGRTLMGERLWDCMRAVDYLASLPDADAGRIGCAGLSLGGEMAMWLGAMDPRVKAVVSSGFLTVMDRMEQNHCMCWKFDGLRELVDWPDVYGLIAPRALMCQNGLKEPPNDFIVPVAREALAEIEPIYAAFGKPENLVLDVHDGAHEVDLNPLLTFFDERL